MKILAIDPIYLGRWLSYFWQTENEIGTNQSTSFVTVTCWKLQGLTPSKTVETRPFLQSFSKFTTLRSILWKSQSDFHVFALFWCLHSRLKQVFLCRTPIGNSIVHKDCFIVNFYVEMCKYCAWFLVIIVYVTVIVWLLCANIFISNVIANQFLLIISTHLWQPLKW